MNELTMPWISQLYEAPNGGALYQSSMITHWSDLDQIKPDMIIDLAGLDADIPQAISEFCYCFWPIDDGPMPRDLECLVDLAAIAAKRITEGKVVLSHCAAGINRSSLMSGVILHNLNVSNGQALVDYIRAHRPGALSNRTFADFLAGYPEAMQLTMQYQQNTEHH